MSLSDFFQVTEMSPFQGRGIVQQAIAPPYAGRVYFRATYWPARLSQTAKLDKLQPGAPVEVVGRDGLTLLV